MISLLDRVIWLLGFFPPLITLNVSCHFILGCRVSIERSAIILIWIPLYVICFFSLIAFKICSLCLIFVSLIHMCLGVCFLGFIHGMGLCGLPKLGGYFLSHVKEVSEYKSPQIFPYPLFSASSGPTLISMWM